MATQKPLTIAPVCQAEGCKEGAQILSIHGTQATHMKTCARHTYQDLPEEQEKLETFWPPKNN